MATKELTVKLVIDSNVEERIRSIVREEIAAHEERLLNKNVIGIAAVNYINDQTKIGRQPIQI